MLNGKLIFYERGFIFVDKKINAFVLSYEDIEEIKFYQGTKHILMQVKSKQNNSLPMNMICGQEFYIFVDQSFLNDNWKMFELLFTKEKSEFKDVKLSRVYEEANEVIDGKVFHNFEINKKYNLHESCEMTNFEFQKDVYEQVLEYLVIEEYNKIKSKGKDFMTYTQFNEMYLDAMSTEVEFQNMKGQLIAKLKD